MERAAQAKTKGEWIGDDGKTMTVARKWCHYLLNTFFIYGLIIIGIGALLGASTLLFMGQTIDDPWTMRWVGGLQYQGFDFALLCRLESIFVIIEGTTLFATSFLGFSWLYDGKPYGTTKHWTITAIGFAVFWFFVALITIGFVDPVAIISIIVAALFLRSSSAVNLDTYISSK